MPPPLTVLIVHGRYQQPGGEDSVFDNESAMLEAAGHTVVRYERHNDEVKRISKLSLFFKTIWNRTTYREICALIRQHHPDVIHCHNIFPLISPSVYWAAARQNVPIVQTLHNYRMICINPYLYRKGKLCELCVGRSPIPGVIRRCYRDSLAASFTVAAMLIIHRMLGTYRNKVTTYMALTEFGRVKFLEARLCDKSKVVVLPNPINAGEAHSPAPAVSAPPENGLSTVLYAGRLSPEKGVHILVEAWRILTQRQPATTERYRLEIVGDGTERESLEASAAQLSAVSFAGHIPQQELHARMAKAFILVLPSTCYETFAMSVNESAALGTPSIVSNIGGQASLVEDGVTGYLFAYGSAESLADVLEKALADPAKTSRIGSNARAAFLASDNPPEKNIQALLKIYNAHKNARAPHSPHFPKQV